MLPARTHRIIYLVLLTLLGGTMVCSVWASNLLWVLLGINWLFEGRWQEKWQLLKHSRLLHTYLALFLLLLAGLLWTSDLTAGMHVIQVSLPLAIVPLVLLTTPAVSGRARSNILWVYSGTVFVVSVITLVRLYTIPGLPYRDAVPYISHIRFALNCCMVIFFCATEIMRAGAWRRTRVAGAVSLIVYMCVFLILLRSYTAVAVLVVVSLFTTLAYFRRWWTVGLWILVVGGGIALVGHEVKTYYTMCPLATAPLQPLTPNGRPYDHACDGVVENGNYVNNYVCSEEMRTAWELRSDMPYDSMVNDGYGIEPVLIRYLNAIGQTKDSVGVAAMTAAQVAAVERGIANPVYDEGNPLRKMVYVMLFEREHHVHTHAVKGFTFLQRIELWSATLQVIAEHPWFGVGTGDAVDALHERLGASQSELAGTGKRSHSQYLTLLAMLGIVGTGIVALLWIRAVVARLRNRSRRKSPLMFSWCILMLISFLTEDTLLTLAGILLCTFFLAFRPSQNN